MDTKTTKRFAELREVGGSYVELIWISLWRANAAALADGKSATFVETVKRADHVRN